MKFVVFALIFASFGAVVALQNATAVTVSFAVWSLQTSLVLVILGSAMVGALIILLLAAPVQIRLRWVADKANRRVSELEAKLQALEEKKLAAPTSELNKENNRDNGQPTATGINKDVDKEMNTDGI
ncbi:hypothetical protein AXX12_05525 [Anaerosporomusa subterranea]|jgi:uncharacterized integral membrane protein|uniref:Lipopolysaccharide assembly protein A domain-containing protein n=1 Tax=Anaerosporomusa subterranea TaxID=1794912 RepID=A0A154BUM8_ANASB|nr:LapA family protein [Anaerosporomusa subterranea]KYZ77565.1 hypothetical protein AXX12_05525 [Anaerosporomusa subterranea]MDF2500214.1 Lipopolysaccharide assembly protein domain protein [Anaerosporomusa subterranea]